MNLQVDKINELFKLKFSDFIIAYNNVNGHVNDSMYTSLMAACFENDIELVDTLLKKGADPNRQCSGYKFTALMIICRIADYEDIDIILMLLKHGADPNIQDAGGYTALMWSNPDNKKIMQILLDNGAEKNINVQNNNGDTILHIICKKQYFHYQENVDRYKYKIENLLKHGADINIQNNNGDTPLMLYISNFPRTAGNYDMLSSFIELSLMRYGADVDLVDRNGDSILTLAATYIYKYTGVFNTLIKYNAHINLRNNLGETAASWLGYNLGETTASWLGYNKHPQLEPFQYTSADSFLLWYNLANIDGHKLKEKAIKKLIRSGADYDIE